MILLPPAQAWRAPAAAACTTSDQDRERECKRQCRHQCASHATDGSQVPRADPQNGGVVEVLGAAWRRGSGPCRHGGAIAMETVSDVIQY